MQLEFKENRVTEWVIESPSLMCGYVEELWKQADGKEGKFVLSENGKELDMGKAIEVFLTPFGVDVNDKKCWSKVVAELKGKAFDETHYVQTQQLFSSIEQYFISLEMDSELDFCYEEIDFGQLLKASGMKLEGDEENLVNHLVQYMKIMVKLLRKKVMVFVNLSSFLEQKELELLFEQAFYLKLHVLLIESKEICLASEKKCFIIDKDKCEIY